MDKLEMTPEQQLAFDGFIDVMVQIYKMTSDKIDYSKVEKAKDKENVSDGAEDEAEAIRIIFDKFTHTNMGYTGVVKYLAQQGISKKARQNGHLTRFSVSTVKAILDNPVYREMSCMRSRTCR